MCFHCYILYFKSEEIRRVEVTKNIKMGKLYSFKSLEQVSMMESELQICLALLSINICEIKVNLTESKLGYICMFSFAVVD